MARFWDRFQQHPPASRYPTRCREGVGVFFQDRYGRFQPQGPLLQSKARKRSAPRTSPVFKSARMQSAAVLPWASMPLSADIVTAMKSITAGNTSSALFRHGRTPGDRTCATAGAHFPWNRSTGNLFQRCCNAAKCRRRDALTAAQRTPAGCTYTCPFFKDKTAGNTMCRDDLYSIF